MNLDFCRGSKVQDVRYLLAGQNSGRARSYFPKSIIDILDSCIRDYDQLFSDDLQELYQEILFTVTHFMDEFFLEPSKGLGS